MSFSDSLQTGNCMQRILICKNSNRSILLFGQFLDKSLRTNAWNTLRAVTGSNRFERTMEVTETEEGAKVVWKTYIDYLAEEREAIEEIRGSIRTYKKGMNLSPSQIVPKIMEDYSLSKENAEDYVKQTLELEKV